MNGLGKSPESPDIKVNGVFKRAHSQLVIVSGVENVDRFTGVQHGFEIPRLEFLSREVCWTNVVQTHRDDLVLLPHVHPVKRLIFGVGYFEWDFSKPSVFVQHLRELFNRGLVSCEKEIDALRSEQYRAFEPQVKAKTSKHRLEFVPVVKVDKTVPGDVHDGAGHD